MASHARTLITTLTRAMEAIHAQVQAPTIQPRAYHNIVFSTAPQRATSTPTHPYVTGTYKGTPSAHAEVAMRAAAHTAQGAIDGLHALLRDTPGCPPDWAFDLRVERTWERMWEWRIATREQTVASAHFSKSTQLGTAVERLVSALRATQCPTRARQWRWGLEKGTYPAADPAQALIVGCGLYAPTRLPDLLKDGAAPTSIAEVYPQTTLTPALQAWRASRPRR